MKAVGVLDNCDILMSYAAAIREVYPILPDQWLAVTAITRTKNNEKWDMPFESPPG